MELNKEIDVIKKPQKKYVDNIQKVREALEEEFKEDLDKWDAEFIKDSLTIRYLSPEIMFDPAKTTIKKRFKNILSNFCPRYFNVLDDFDFIEEVRIEGHTSNEWFGLKGREVYFKNMELSQGRTRSVLEYCVNNEKNPTTSDWAIKHLTANGLSSSRPICEEDSVRCRTKNRRVDFAVQVKNPIKEKEIAHLKRELDSIKTD